MFSEVLQRSGHWSNLKIHLSRDWINSLESKSYIEELLNEDGTKKFFTLYDSPPIPKGVPDDLKPDLKKFKVYLIGKPGAGKTSISHTLIGLKRDFKVYESLGIIVQTIYWPVCELGKGGKESKIRMVCLELWDCGARVSAQYPYLMQECTKNADACILVFSLTDRASWDDMPNMMGRASEFPTLQMMIGTRLDKLHDSQVRVEELRHFERLYNLPLLLIGSKSESKDSTSTKRPTSLTSSSSSSSSASPAASDAKQAIYDMSGFITQLCDFQIFIITISAETLAFPFYVCWIVCFLYEIFYLRRKIHGLLYRGSSFETDNLLYKTRGDYYTYLLFVVIAIFEPLSLVPVILSGLPTQVYFSDNISPNYFDLYLDVALNCRVLTYIFQFFTVFVVNLLTSHLIRVCKSNTRIQLLPPIQNKLILLTLIILLLAIIKLAILEVGDLIIMVFSSLLYSFEIFCLIKNSKQLYYLLKWRYEDLRNELNYPLYKAHRRIALRYKYVTICLTICFVILNISAWFYIPISIFLTLLKYPINIPELLILPFEILKWFDLVLAIIGSGPQILIVAGSLYYIVTMCWNKLVSGFGRERVHYLCEPILQR
ncbi:REM2- and Rab-like small GTPase 1 [Oopsacas minuta]|uniref:Ciliogenesis and planar polarity effector 2 n=1 Tax=Oopsacas minuta TaxID=111878 RepID=A0AAV7JDB8_9METZ|nr:REM2- and Rab-like small GTPase 1 [Oopsacas minuta]